MTASVVLRQTGRSREKMHNAVRKESGDEEEMKKKINPETENSDVIHRSEQHRTERE